MSVQVLLPMLNARGISTVVHAAGALNRNDTEGLQVTFATYAGLFCQIRRPLLPNTQASFAEYTGLFCGTHRPLLY